MSDKHKATALHHPQKAAFAGKDGLLDGRYRLVRLLGEGGMGAVYLAEHVILGRQVAIKFLLSDHVSKADMIARFHREARAAATIHHKNIIEIFDVGVSQQGSPFLVMEYLEGESLATLLKRAAPLNLGETCAILEQALLGLQAAHRKGILHRDLKPDNLFLAYVPNEPPVVKLIDFGISKFMEGAPDQSRTQTGSVMGTPAYMSPEQARGLSTVDQRSDLFSMGTILYEMLTGSWPFAGDTFGDLLANLLTEPPKPPSQVRADFPVQAEPLIAKALAKDPNLRFQTVDEMLDGLRSLDGFAQRLERLASLASTIRRRGFAAGDLGQPSLHKDSTGDAGRPQEEEAVPTIWTRRRMALGIAGLAVLVGVGAAIVWGTNGGHKDKPAVAAQPPLTAPAPPPVVNNPPPMPTTEPAPNLAVTPTEAAKPEPPSAQEVDPRERTEKPATAVPVKAKSAPGRAAKPAATKSPAPSGKEEGKGLRSGSRGTKMVESFE